MNFKIENGIAIPDIQRGRPPKYPWKSMKVGDSFVFGDYNPYNRRKAANAVYAYMKTTKTQKCCVFIARRTKNHIRIFRTK